MTGGIAPGGPMNEGEKEMVVEEEEVMQMQRETEASQLKRDNSEQQL